MNKKPTELIDIALTGEVHLKVSTLEELSEAASTLAKIVVDYVKEEKLFTTRNTAGADTPKGEETK